MKKLYYDCPIKALYMMKEFGVKFECQNSDEELIEFDLNEEDRLYPFEHNICESQTIEDLLEIFKDFRKIYVAKESLHIFEPKDKDIGTEVKYGGIYKYEGEGGVYYDKEDWTWSEYGGRDCISGEVIEIIMREGKQFFMPKEGND